MNNVKYELYKYIVEKMQDSMSELVGSRDTMGNPLNLAASKLITELEKQFEYGDVRVIGLDNKEYVVDSKYLELELLLAKTRYPKIGYDTILLHGHDRFCVKGKEVFKGDNKEVGKYLMENDCPLIFFRWYAGQGSKFVFPNTYEILNKLINNYKSIHVKKRLLQVNGMIDGLDIDDEYFELKYLIQSMNGDATDSYLLDKAINTVGIDNRKLFNIAFEYNRDYNINIMDYLYRVIILDMSDTDAFNMCKQEIDKYGDLYIGTGLSNCRLSTVFNNIISYKIKEMQREC